MTDRPDIPQFEAWLDRYGTNVGDWPADIRRRAQPLVSEPDYRKLVDRARDLDSHLDEWSVSPPSTALRLRIEETIALPLRPSQRFRLWWTGLGLAAALAGAAAGSAAAAMGPPSDATTNMDTVFGDLDGMAR